MNRNRSWARQTHSRDIINILLTSFYVTDLSFSPLRFMALSLHASAINRREKTRYVASVRPSNSVSKRFVV